MIGQASENGAADFMANAAANVVGGVIGGFILAAMVWGGRRAYKWGRQWLADRKAAASDARAKAEKETVQVLREQVLEVAKSRGFTLPEKHQRVGAATV